MSKINDNLILYSLVLIALLMLGVTIFTLLPKEAVASNNSYGWAYDGDPFFVEKTPTLKPVIYSINPNPVVRSSSITTITIYGEDFIFGAVAKINDSDRTTTFVNSGQLKVQLIDSDLVLGEHPITVYNPGRNARSNAYSFSVISKLPSTNASASTTTSTASTTTYKATSTNSKVAGASTEKDSAKESFGSLATSAIFGGDSFMPSGLVQWLLLAIFILLVVIIVRKIFGAKQYHETPLKHA
ncbi:MAG: IPT/TIG domain-containing protein [bacterium]|nr:IPT/TIG domain-containing protein [bacterium]